LCAKIALAAAVMAWAGAGAEDLVSADAAAAYEHVSCVGAPNELRIVVTNVKRGEGLVTADLYRNDEDGFLNKRGRVNRARFAARAPYTIFCLTAPAPGDFALAVYHDRNANKAFDKNSIGLPAEPYGISNNPKFRFGPPKVREALFTVAAEGKIVEIALRN
jgi:uncharacterized protein (DUF2141 family)